MPNILGSSIKFGHPIHARSQSGVQFLEACSNYHPISLLPNIEKILEKSMYKRLYIPFSIPITLCITYNLDLDNNILHLMP